MRDRLLLFDIDGTLVRWDGAGIRAMEKAAGDLFGVAASEIQVDYAGRLDPLIMTDILKKAGVAPTTESMQEFRATYHAVFLEMIGSGAAKWAALPGVLALLESAYESAGSAVGVLTGNFPETGAIKLRAAGIDPDRFHISVWGDESPHDEPAREHLPALGLERWSALLGEDPEPERLVIIGDTPHDVSCAKANGCRCLGVATGVHSEEELNTAGADHVFPDLSDVSAVLEWLLD